MFSHANSKKRTYISGKPNGNQIKICRPKIKHREKPFTTTRILIVSFAFIHNYTTDSCTQQMNTVKTFQDDLRSSHAKTSEKSQHDTTLPLQLCSFKHFTKFARTCITHSARLACLETKHQQRYMSALIVLRQNKTSSHPPKTK